MIQELAKNPWEILFELILEHELVFDNFAMHWKMVEHYWEYHLFYSGKKHLYKID